MSLIFVEAAHAMGGAPGQGSSNPIASLFPIVLMFAVLYFLILRPQIRKQKSQQKMVDELKKGDLVVTSGGTYIPSVHQSRYSALPQALGDPQQTCAQEVHPHGAAT